MAFTSINDSISADDLKYDFLPALGTDTQAHLVHWGADADGSDDNDLKVGLIEDLLAGTPGAGPGMCLGFDRDRLTSL
jgi:hypothetical protein